MQLLVQPQPFSDESLESYLLRLTEANFLESYRLLSGAVKEWLQEQDHEAGGAFPLDLKIVNIWHARQNSSFRVRALSLFEKLTENEGLPLLALSLRNSAADFCGNYRAVARGGEHIPRCFIRKSSIPVCPLCLSEILYIPQAWHYIPYTACAKHGVDLVRNCPSCGAHISYLDSEVIGHCQCGYDLSLAPVTPADQKSLWLSNLVVRCDLAGHSPLEETRSFSIRYAALLYFCIINDADVNNEEEIEKMLREAVGFYTCWPRIFNESLSSDLDLSKAKLVKGYNKTAVSFALGSKVLASDLIRGLPLKENFILKEVLSFLSDVVASHPKSNLPNYGDMLLTVKESAALLQTTQEQVYLLFEDGYLLSSSKISSHVRFPPSQPVFFLRQVMELSKAKMPADFGASATYLPHW